MHTHSLTCTHTRTLTKTHTQTLTYTHTHTNTLTYTHTRTQQHTHLLKRTYMHTLTYTHTHSFTRTHTRFIHGLRKKCSFLAVSIVAAKRRQSKEEGTVKNVLNNFIISARAGFKNKPTLQQYMRHQQKNMNRLGNFVTNPKIAFTNKHIRHNQRLFKVVRR